MNSRYSRGNFFDAYPGLTALLMVIGAFYILQMILQSKLPPEVQESTGGFFYGIHPDVVITLGSSSLPLTFSGEYWRVMASTFLHGGLAHLAMNGFVLYQTARIVEPLAGTARFLTIYFICGFCGSIASIGWRFWEYHALLAGRFGENWTLAQTFDALEAFPRGAPGSVGASGAIFGMIGVLLGFAIRHRDSEMKKSLISNIVFIFILTFVISGGMVRIDHAGHIGGLVAGTGLGWFLPRYSSSDVTRHWKIPAWITCSLTGICLCFALWNHFKDQFQ